MTRELQRIKERLSKKPCCKTFMCLVKRKTLPDGVMPKWITKMVNWTIEG